MSSYLDLLEEKKRLGLISPIFFYNQKKWYNNKSVAVKWKEKADTNAENDLALLKEDKMFYLNTVLVQEMKNTTRYTKNILNWVTFFGILYIVSAIIVALSFLNL